MVYHQSCRNCTRILTGEEMGLHLKDKLGLCKNCRAKKHADTLVERITKEETNG